MYKNLLTLTLLTIAFYTSLQGQNITTATLRWNSSQVLNTTTGDLSEVRTTLLTHGKNQVELLTANGSSRSFTVNEVVGVWENVSDDGEVVYGIGNNEEGGTITFIRSEGEIKVKLLLIKADVPELHEFKISNVQVIN